MFEEGTLPSRIVSNDEENTGCADVSEFSPFSCAVDKNSIN